MRPRHRGFTLIELLVVIAIIAILIALLVPAVQKVRESAARTTCENNLKQLIMGVHSYVDANGFIPYSVSSFGEGPGPQNGRGWILEVLPYIEQKELYLAFEGSRTTTIHNYPDLMQTQLSILRCPSDRSTGTLMDNEWQWEGQLVAVTNYKGVIGTSNMGGGWPDSPMGMTDNHNNTLPTGLFFRNSYQVKIKLKKIIDGTSNTLAIGEDIPDYNYHGVAFYSNGDYASSHAPINYIPQPPTTPRDWPKVMSFRSRHRGGLNFAAADGSVHFIREDIDRLLYQQLCTRAGEEPVSIPQ